MSFGMGKEFRWHRMGEDADWGKLSRLDQEIYPSEDCISGEEYLRYFSNGNICWLLLGGDGSWVANFQVTYPFPFSSKFPSEDLDPTTSAYFCAISVFHPFQGRGFGHIAMQKLLLEYGHLQLLGRVRIDNLRSLHLMETYGFHFIGQEFISGSEWGWHKFEGRS